MEKPVFGSQETVIRTLRNPVPVIFDLTNEAHVVPTDAEGNNGNYTGCGTTVVVYGGSVDETTSWNVSAVSSLGVTGILSGYTYTVSNMTTDTGYVDITVSRIGYESLTKRFSISKSKNGIAYWINSSVGAIQKSQAGEYTPATITFSAICAVAAGSVSDYAGRYVISETTDGTNWIIKYTSANNEISKTYTPSSDIKALKVQLFLAGGTTYKLDEEIIPIVSDGMPGADGADGADGINARAVNLTSDVLAFTYDTAGASPTPSSATIIANALNTQGTVYYEFFKNDVSVKNTTSNTYTYTPQSSYSSMPDKIEVQIREGSSTGAVLARDQITIIGMKAGSHGLSISMSNEAHVVPSDSSGNVTDYSNSGTIIKVYEGSSALTYVTSLVNSSFVISSVDVSPIGKITVGTITGTSTTSAIVGDHSDMDAATDLVVLTYNITAKRSDGLTVPLVVTQSISKSKQGTAGADGADGADGIDARTVNLTSEALAFTYNTAGVSPSPSSVTITANVLNTQGTVYYEFFKNDVSVQNTTSNSYTYTPQSNYTSMPDKIEVQIRENASTGTVLARDQITIIGMKAGSHGLSIVSSNEAHVVPSDNNGTVLDYSNSGTTIKVYEGSSALTYVTSLVNSSFVINSIDDSPVGKITIGTVSGSGTDSAVVGNHSNMDISTDLVVLTYNITAKRSDGLTVPLVVTQSISKSKQGIAGTRTAILRMYKWSATEPTTFPSGTSTYTWSTGTFTTPSTPNNWTINPSAAVAGQTLWECHVIYTDTDTSATSIVTWNTSTAYPVGTAGILTPGYLGKYDSAHPETHNNEDWWLVYDTDDSPIQRGIYYDNLGTITRISAVSGQTGYTTDQKLLAKLQAVIGDAAWCEKNGYGLVVNYGISIYFDSIAAVTAFIQNLFAQNIVLGTTGYIKSSNFATDPTGFPSAGFRLTHSTGVLEAVGAKLDIAEVRGVKWSSPVQLGSGLSISGIGYPALAALNSTDVAFIDSANDSLRVYRWNGSSWAQVGSGLTISGAGSAALAALNSTDVAFIDSVNDSLRVYRWNGSSWAQVGSAGSISLSGGIPALAAMNGTDVPFIDNSNDSLRTYRFGFALATPYHP